MNSDMKPLISIITPTYNHEKYIQECIESVLEQTYSNWELIIVDDNSEDNTVEIIEGYRRRYPDKIKLIRHKERYGPLNLDKTYNEALNHCSGEWIAILEGDDVWPIYKLERQVEYLLKYKDKNVVLLHGNVGLIRQDMGLVSISYLDHVFKKRIPEYKPYDPLHYMLYGINPIGAVTALVRKDTLYKIGGFIQEPKEIRLVDFPTFIRLALEGRFFYIPEVLGFWRRHSSSITINYYENIAVNFVKTLELFVEQYRIDTDVPKECLGILAYFPLITSCILNYRFTEAQEYYRKIKRSLRKCDIPLNKSIGLKLLVISFLIKIKSKKLVEFIINNKRKYLDEKLCDYKPFFFREFNERTEQ